ncbi:membrane-associated PAP2 superfamily phosphatase [Elusimicrobium simillimum]|uniref:phosphatase PAP2 family protein n=1 Tax=Elusimicrobium simillimum TaxID=3143438 RepID=UPI003C6FE0E6
MKIQKQLIITALLLGVVLLAEQFTSMDIKVQNMFFDFSTCSWVLNKSVNTVLHFLLYDGIKILIIALSILVIGLFAYSFKNTKLRQYRYGCLLFILTMALVPLTLAGAKKYTNVYCPAQLACYCADKPYAKVFSSYPPDFDRAANKKGRCFPAGHASGGFALMCLFFCFKRKKYKIAGLITGLSSGLAMGIYQMLRGEHFLTHTLITMLGAWFIILLLVLFVKRVNKKFPAVAMLD